MDGVGALGFIEHAESIFAALFREPTSITRQVSPAQAVAGEEESELFPGLLDVLPEPLVGE